MGPGSGAARPALSLSKGRDDVVETVESCEFGWTAVRCRWNHQSRSTPYQL